MTLRLLHLVMDVAYRQARRYSSKLWWAVLLVAWLIARSEDRPPATEHFHLRGDHAVTVEVVKGAK
jgi:hypothetical protein